MATKKKAKTKEDLQEVPQEIPGGEPAKDLVLERLDRIIELLTLISKDSEKIPFKGLDLSSIL